MNFEREYVQVDNLSQIFDLSVDYFMSRRETDFFLGKHYFIPPTSSKTKKAILWDLNEIRSWLRTSSNSPAIDTELAELLQRS